MTTETPVTPVDNTPAPELSLDTEITDQQMENFFNSEGGELDEDTSGETPTSEETAQTISDKKSIQATDDDGDATDDELDAKANDEAGQSDQQRYKSMAESERVKRKEVQKQIDAIKQENENLKNTFNRILTKAQEQQMADEAANAPSFEDDPIAALKAENDRIKRDLEEFKTEKTQANEQNIRAQREEQFVNTYRQKAAEFEKVTPDFKSAYKFLAEKRLEELRIDWSEDEARQVLIEEEAATVAKALSNGKNPAESIYKMAKLRGYTGNSSINAQDSAKDKIAANNERIANLERGIKASKSVNTGGMNAPETLTLEAVAAMDDDEFASTDWNKIMKLG